MTVVRALPHLTWRKEMEPLTKTFWVKVTSHRGREKMYRLLGFKPQSYFAWGVNGEWYQLPERETKESILSIKGVSLVKKLRNDLCRTW